MSQMTKSYPAKISPSYLYSSLVVRPQCQKNAHPAPFQWFDRRAFLTDDAHNYNCGATCQHTSPNMPTKLILAHWKNVLRRKSPLCHLSPLRPTSPTVWIAQLRTSARPSSHVRENYKLKLLFYYNFSTVSTLIPHNSSEIILNY